MLNFNDQLQNLHRYVRKWNKLSAIQPVDNPREKIKQLRSCLKTEETAIVRRICMGVWATGDWSENWMELCLFRKKGDPKQCSNSQVIGQLHLWATLVRYFRVVS